MPSQSWKCLALLGPGPCYSCSQEYLKTHKQSKFITCFGKKEDILNTAWRLSIKFITYVSHHCCLIASVVTAFYLVRGKVSNSFFQLQFSHLLGGYRMIDFDWSFTLFPWTLTGFLIVLPDNFSDIWEIRPVLCMEMVSLWCSLNFMLALARDHYVFTAMCITVISSW